MINFLKNNYTKILIVVFLIVFVSLISYLFRDDKPSKDLKVEDINYVKISGEKIKVELALTPENQEKGLSNISSIGENEGMLFIFEKPLIHNFWMKDMNFPIDIIWIDKDMKVIFIEKNVKPDTYPQTFGPNKDSQYVLEVNALFSEKNNLKVNDSVIFLP